MERLANAVNDQVRRFARAISGTRRGEVSAVHQARVASRRLRELLPVAAWAGPDELARRVRGEVRRVTQTLGAVRELDVTKDVLKQGAQRHQWDAVAVTGLRRRMEVDRKRLHGILAAELRDRSARQMLRDLTRVVTDITAGPSPDRRWLEKLHKRRRQRARSLGAKLRELGALYVPLRLHAVRIAAKKLRYSLEAERAIRGAAVIRDIRTLEAMQEHLGHLHDLQILQERVHGSMREAAADLPLRRQLQRMRADLDVECRAMHSQVLGRVDKWLTLADRVAAR